MCGIAGMVLAPGERVDEELLRRMTETLRHRGPDDDGYLVDGNVGIGHRRLSIIDLSSRGRQPLFDEDGDVAVVFNGEIYDFHRLRADLEQAGHRFASDTDTEVIVHLWEEKGPRLVECLRGMFAIALYDRRTRQLFLARDRFGKKPLYVATLPDGLFFASELGALLEVPTVRRRVDPVAVAEYVCYAATGGERTIFRDVRKLLPASRVLVDTAAPPASIAPERYWRFEALVGREAPEKEGWLDRLDATLSEAVRLRLIADVPLGAFLSGGIDSSLIVAKMVEQAPGRVRTFSIGFTESRWDESVHARSVAEALGTEHHEETVTADAIAVLPQLVEAYDEPYADPSAIPTWYLSRMTRRHVTVALSGDGGDELFMGYTRHRESQLLDRLATLATAVGRGAAGGVSRLLPAGTAPERALERLSRQGLELYRHALGWSRAHLALLTPQVRQRALATDDAHWRSLDASLRHLPRLDRYRAVDVATYLPDDILVKVDRASMQHALEVRCPLLDQEVAAVAAAMPASEQMAATSGKVLLKRLAHRHLPRRLLERPKQGFAVPLVRWFRGELRPQIEEAVDDGSSPMWEWFDRGEARRRLDSHLAGTDHSRALWRLLVFHRWVARFLP